MTPTDLRRRGPRKGGRKRASLPALAAVCLAFLVILAEAGGAAAQESIDVGQSQLEYMAALGEYQAALDHYRGQHNLYVRLNDDVRAARAAGNEDALDLALGRALERAQELQRLEVRVQERRDRLDLARAGLLAALDDEVDRVQQQLAANPPTDVARDLLAVADGLRAQYFELEAEANDVLTPRNVVLPQLRYDPRDTPGELRNKVDFAERRADQLRAELEEQDRQISRVERLLRVERSRGDFLGQLSRFGDDQVPVGQPGQARERGGAVADTAGLAPEDFPLDQQLERLRAHRQQSERLMQIMEELVQELRAHLPRTEASRSGRPGAPS